MLASCCPQGCFFLLTCLGRQGCHAACFTAHREAEKTTKSSTAISCPKHSLSLLLLLTDTRREHSSSRETVIKYNRFVFVRRSWLKLSSWFGFTIIFSVRVDVVKGYSKVLTHSSTLHSDPSLASQGTECQSLIFTFQCGVKFASLCTVQ